MGTFVGVMGDVSIPKEQWETYVAQMLTVLTQGGSFMGKTSCSSTSRNSILTEALSSGSIIILKTIIGSRARWTRPAG